MTKKIIKSSDVLGDNYYIYELSSSNYTPALNGTITITCTVTDVYGDPIGSKLITLYKNGTSVSTKTTNSSGVATWSVTCSTAGIQSFKVENKAIEIFVDNKSDTGHTHTTTDITNLSIPSASNTTPSADTTSGSVGTGTTWARSNHTHPKSSLYAESSHAHGNLQNNGQVGSTAQANKNVVTNSSGLITTEDKPTIPSKTSQLTNDSGFLTSHQSLDSKTVTVEKLATAESGYLSSYAVKQNGVQVGNTINIPKDFLVKSGSVKTVSTANNPVSGYSVGDKYIDLVINVKEGTDTDSHIYILVSDLVDTPVTISDVTGLQTALNGKANSSHTHNTTEIRDSSAYNRIGSSVNDTQANINNSIDIALAGLDDNILYTKMDLIGLGEFQVKDFINPNNWKNSEGTYSDGVLTFLGSNSFTATFPTDFELSFDYIIDHGLGLGDTIYFDIFGHEAQYIVTEDDYDNSYVIIDVSFKSENNEGIITSEASGDEWHINYVDQDNPYTIDVTPLEYSIKIANIQYKANNIISLNDNKEDAYNKVTSLSSSSTDTQYPSAKVVYDSLDVKEDKSNKVTSISSSSTDTQYPSAKCTYNQLAKKLDKEEDNFITVTNSNIWNYSDYHTKDRWTLENGHGGSTTSTTLTSGSQGDAFYSYNFPSNVTSVTMQFSSDATNAFIYDNDGYSVVINSSAGERTYTATSDDGLNIEIIDANKTVTYTITSITFNMNNWIDKIYPIGAIYISMVNVAPSTLFGGEWTALEGRFLIGQDGTNYWNDATGGSADAVVVTHNHTQDSHSHEPSNTDYKFLAATTNIAINGTKRVFPSSTSGAYHFVYTEDATGGINEYDYTNSKQPYIYYSGVSGTGKNMPPYLAVYMWKRIG